MSPRTQRHNEKCFSCGKPCSARTNYCLGCDQIVCLTCCEQYGHAPFGDHGWQSPIVTRAPSAVAQDEAYECWHADGNPWAIQALDVLAPIDAAYKFVGREPPIGIHGSHRRSGEVIARVAVRTASGFVHEFLVYDPDLCEELRYEFFWRCPRCARSGSVRSRSKHFESLVPALTRSHFFGSLACGASVTQLRILRFVDHFKLAPGPTRSEGSA